jgi:nucleotide-binding universal stress UspA family protein
VLDVARELSAVHHAAIQAVSVIGPESLSRRKLQPDCSPVADRAEDRRQAQLNVTDDVHGRVPEGDAVDVLVDVSDEVDLLIVGSCGHGRTGRLINGSTARRLAARTPCPLLVLPSNPEAATVPHEPSSSDPRALSPQGV